MGRFPVSETKEKQLLERMEALGVREEDLVERFVKGTGPGGQKINKTSSCVYLCHTPSELEVKCQQARSQSMNRYLARREICDRIEEQVKGVKSRRQQMAEKIRRQKRRRSRRAKAKMLEAKRKNSQQKDLRKTVRGEE